jgi:hypothetical protein
MRSDVDNPGDAYRFVAERADGSTFDVGGDLSDCTRCTLIPTAAPLPLVSIAGVPMLRRFGRGFASLGRENRYLQCVVTPSMRVWVDCTSGAVRITGPDDEVRL